MIKSQQKHKNIRKRIRIKSNKNLIFLKNKNNKHLFSIPFFDCSAFENNDSKELALVEDDKRSQQSKKSIKDKDIGNDNNIKNEKMNVSKILYTFIASVVQSLIRNPHIDKYREEFYFLKGRGDIVLKSISNLVDCLYGDKDNTERNDDDASSDNKNSQKVYSKYNIFNNMSEIYKEIYRLSIKSNPNFMKNAINSNTIEIDSNSSRFGNNNSGNINITLNFPQINPHLFRKINEKDILNSLEILLNSIQNVKKIGKTGKNMKKSFSIETSKLNKFLVSKLKKRNFLEKLFSGIKAEIYSCKACSISEVILERFNYISISSQLLSVVSSENNSKSMKIRQVIQSQITEEILEEYYCPSCESQICFKVTKTNIILCFPKIFSIYLEENVLSSIEIENTFLLNDSLNRTSIFKIYSLVKLNEEGFLSQVKYDDSSIVEFRDEPIFIYKSDVFCFSKDVKYKILFYYDINLGINIS